jgi:hypothetical protein
VDRDVHADQHGDEYADSDANRNRDQATYATAISDAFANAGDYPDADPGGGSAASAATADERTRTNGNAVRAA